MLSVIIMSVVMMSVVMLSVIMIIGVAASFYPAIIFSLNGISSRFEIRNRFDKKNYEIIVFEILESHD